MYQDSKKIWKYFWHTTPAGNNGLNGGCCGCCCRHRRWRKRSVNGYTIHVQPFSRHG